MLLSTGCRDAMLGKHQELVTNTSFTSNTNNWTGSTATLASVAGGQSGNCLQVTGNGGAGYAYCDTITIKKGYIYKFSGYFKKGTGTQGRIKIGTAADDATYYDSGNVTDASWTEYETFFRVPEAAGSTNLVITVVVDADAVTQLYDEITLSPFMRSFQDIFQDCNLKIFGGSIPATANAAETGTLLCTYWSDYPTKSAGLEFDDSSSGSISKASTETWSGDVIEPGTNTATYFRLVADGDTGASSTTQVRVQGTVGTTGTEDLVISSTSFAYGAVQTVTNFTITLPAGS